LNRQGLKDRLLRLARTQFFGPWIRWSFAHMSFAIPVKRLYETETLMAFHHPRPSHALHILIVPKREIGSLVDLPPEDTALLQEMLETAQYLIKAFQLEQGGYRLITNGGAYQDVPLLHIHLISDTSPEPKTK
jgi:histidine triad (HIT) family protein